MHGEVSEACLSLRVFLSSRFFLTNKQIFVCLQNMFLGGSKTGLCSFPSQALFRFEGHDRVYGGKNHLPLRYKSVKFKPKSNATASSCLIKHQSCWVFCGSTATSSIYDHEARPPPTNGTSDQRLNPAHRSSPEQHFSTYPALTECRDCRPQSEECPALSPVEQKTVEFLPASRNALLPPRITLS